MEICFSFLVRWNFFPEHLEQSSISQPPHVRFACNATALNVHLGHLYLNGFSHVVIRGLPFLLQKKTKLHLAMSWATEVHKTRRRRRRRKKKYGKIRKKEAEPEQNNTTQHNTTQTLVLPIN